MTTQTRCLAVGLLILASLTRLDLAATQGSQEVLSFSRLQLRASTADRQLAFLEPVPITLTISNESGRPILGHSDISFSSNHVEAFVRQDDGTVARIDRLSAVVAQVLVSRPRIIRPGEHHSVSELINLDLDKVFPRPGMYELYFRVYDFQHRETIQSNPVTVRLIQPQGLDLAAYDYIMGSGQAAQVFSGLGLADGEETRQVLEELVRSYGGTRYADYASLSLGQFFFYLQDFARAREQLEKVAGKGTFPLAKTALDYLAKARAGIKR